MLCSRAVDFWILQLHPQVSWILWMPPVWPLTLHLRAEELVVGMRAGSWAENLEKYTHSITSLKFATMTTQRLAELSLKSGRAIPERTCWNSHKVTFGDAVQCGAGEVQVIAINLNAPLIITHPEKNRSLSRLELTVIPLGWNVLDLDGNFHIRSVTTGARKLKPSRTNQRH